MFVPRSPSGQYQQPCSLTDPPPVEASRLGKMPSLPELQEGSIGPPPPLLGPP